MGLTLESVRHSIASPSLEQSLGEVSTVWHVDVCKREGECWRLDGLTRDTVAIWGDTYWFSLKTGRARIQYWGDRILLREDRQCSR